MNNNICLIFDSYSEDIIEEVKAFMIKFNIPEDWLEMRKIDANSIKPLEKFYNIQRTYAFIIRIEESMLKKENWEIYKMNYYT